MLSDDRLKRLAKDFYSHVLEQENLHRLKMGVIQQELREKRQKYYEEVAENSRQSLAQNRLFDVVILTEAMLRRQGIKPSELEQLEIAQARQAILRAGIDLADAVAARYRGDFNHKPADTLLLAALSEADCKTGSEVPPKSRSEEKPSETQSSAEETSGAPKLSAIFENFAENQVIAGAWERQTQSQSRASFRLFIEVAGDLPLAGYARKDAGKFREAVQRLPADYGKAAKYRDLRVNEIIELHSRAASEDRQPFITQKTIKRHFSALSALWEDAISKGIVSENIFKGFRFATAKKASEERDMWEPNELELLFGSPIWKGCHSLDRRSQPGSNVIRDEKFWLPLIAVFSGLRQEEICQLHVADIKQQEDVWYFDINADPPRQLKNDTAVRRVPIHSQLVAIGLLDFVQEARAASQLRVFPDLRPGGADRRLGHGYTKWFTRYRRSINLYRKGLDFHSFRHSATTFLHNAGVERTLVDHLTGHVTPGETTRYTKRTSIRLLKEAIEKLNIDVDLSHLSIHDLPH